MVMWNERSKKKITRPAQWWEVVALLILMGIIAFILLEVDPANAKAIDTAEVLNDILAERHSPLVDAADDAVYYWRRHRDWWLPGLFVVAWAETNLGRDSFFKRTRNPVCIRGGSADRPWRWLRVDRTKGGFNVYPSVRVGQRAAIYLLHARYNSLLQAHDWRGFTKKFWGDDYYRYPDEREAYIKTLATAYKLIRADAAERGLRW